MKILSITLLGNKPEEGFVSTIDAQGFKCVGVPINKIALACNSSEVDSNGIYFLVNRNESVLSKRYVYVGQTKQGPKRLLDHKQTKTEWEFAYMFLGPKSSLNRQIVDELEAYEIKRYKSCEAFNCLQKGGNYAEVSEMAKTIAKEIEMVMTFFNYGIEQSLGIQNNAKKKELAEQVNENNNIEEKIYLDSGVIVTGHSPYRFVFRDKVYEDEKMTYKTILKVIVDTLFKEQPEKFIELANKYGTKDQINEVRNVNNGGEIYTLADGIYIETRRSAMDILKFLKKLLAFFDIDIRDLYFYVN